jgi:hypothetical protein
VYWPQHAGLSKTEFAVMREHESFFLSNSRSWGKWMRHYNSLQASFSNRLDVGFSTLHAAARWGIPQLIQVAITGPNADFDHLEPAPARKILIDSEFRTDKGVTPLVEAARNGRVSIMKILLERGPQNQRINQNVMIAAAGNTMHGDKVVAFLLTHHRNQVQITDDMIKVVSQNRPHGKLIMGLFLNRCNDQIQRNSHLVYTIIENFDVMVVTFLLNQCKEPFQITEDMIEATARNDSHGTKIMALMLQRYRDQIRDNPRLVPTIIQNFDLKVVKFALSQLGNCIRLTDDIFRAAARNHGHENVMFLLLDQYGDEI